MLKSSSFSCIRSDNLLNPTFMTALISLPSAISIEIPLTHLILLKLSDLVSAAVSDLYQVMCALFFHMTHPASPAIADKPNSNIL